MLVLLMSAAQSIPEKYLPVREKYFKMAEATSIDEAVTKLHNKIGELEPKVFDGGFNQERFEQLQILREISRELWNLRLSQTSDEAKA